MPARPNPAFFLFLLTMKEDSIEGIYDTLKQCAKISQSAAHRAFHHNIRATGSYIRVRAALPTASADAARVQ